MKQITNFILALYILVFISTISFGQTPHPRVNLTPARISTLKVLANSTNPRWVALKKAADASISTPSITDAPNLALVYVMSGTVSYGTAAIGAAMAQATQPVGANNVSFDSWYSMRSTYMAVVRVYDWCYPLLTAAQKSVISQWLMDTAAACWNRPGGWSINDPEDNYFYGFMYTGMAGLACLGDDVRAQSEIDRWKSNFDKLVVPAVQGHSAGGTWTESNSYGLYNSNMLAVQVDAYQTALAVDITTNQAAGSFFGQVCTYTLVGTTPDLLYHEPFGSQSRNSIPFLMEYDRDAVLPAANLAGGTFLSDVKTWLNITPQPSMAIRAWSEFLWYPDGVVGTDYRTTQPNSYFAPGMGCFFFRQNWTATATEWNVWSGPLNQSHEDPNCNGFQIYKGGSWLVPTANLLSASGILGEQVGTIAFNNITVGGKGQMTGYSGQVQAREVGADWVYYRGQAAQPYQVATDTNGGRAILATDVTRKIVYIPGADTFVISDRVTKTNPANTTKFHLHSKSQPVVAGNTASWDNGTYKAVLTSQIAPVIVPELYGSGGAISSYRIDEVGSGGFGTDRLINALQVIPVGGAGPPVSSLTCSTHDVRQAGKWLIAIGKTEGVSGAVSFTNPGASECVITDLLPNTVYGAITSTASGTLRFSLPGGTTTISVSPGSVAPPTDYSALYAAELAAHLADNAANAATIATLTGNLATAVGQRDILQNKLDALASALKAVLGIP